MKNLFVITLLLFIAPSVAFPCLNNFQGLGTNAEEPLVSSDGAYVFEKEGVVLRTVRVADADGMEQLGTVTKLGERHMGWAPEVPLPTGEYTIVTQYEERGELHDFMRVAATPELAPPTLSDVDIRWAARGKWGCCQSYPAHEGKCAIDCGHNVCNSCWTHGVEVIPQASAYIQGEPGTSLLAARLKGGNEIAAAWWSNEPPVLVDLPPSIDEACIEAVRIDGAGNVTVGDTKCVSLGDYHRPEDENVYRYEVVMDAITDPPPNCLGPPVDIDGQPDPTIPTGPGIGEDECSGTDTPESCIDPVDTEDTEDPADPTNPSSGEDGCSTSGIAPPSSTFWLVLLGLLILPRRR